MMNQVELAYFAGIIDGESNVALYEDRPVIKLTNTYEPLLVWVTELTGSKYAPQRSRPICSNSCISSHVHRRKQPFIWVCCGTRAQIILYNVQPYLLEKQERVALILAHYHGSSKTVKRHMTDLGWEIP